MDCGVAWTWRNAVNRERWEKIKDLFGSTVELDPSQRSAFLRDACGSDEALRAEVESLLASYQRTEALDEHQPPQPYGEKLVGRRLGAYKVLHEMGQGGMAAVYAAVRADDEYRMIVAFKVLLPLVASEYKVCRTRNEWYYFDATHTPLTSL